MEEIDDKLEELQKRTVMQTNTPWDASNTVIAVVLLAKSVRQLDKTSTRLAKIYIWLTVVLGFIGIVQVTLMFRGH